MTFQPNRVDDFLAVFNANKERIRGFQGCEFLELIQDTSQPNVLMTHSHWESAESLETYRHSELFQNTWAKTKVLFAEKPSAQSFNRIAQLP